MIKERVGSEVKGAKEQQEKEEEEEEEEDEEEEDAYADGAAGVRGGT